MKRFAKPLAPLATLALAALIGGAAAFAGDAGKVPATKPANTPINKKCPVQGDDVDPKVTLIYKGKVIGFCCRDCIEDFKKDPESYMARINKEQEQEKK